MNYYLMETQLSGSYREVFERAQLYAAMKNIDTDFMDERLSELYDMLITAQAENKPAERIVGRDTDAFCRDMFEDFTLAERLRSLPKREFTCMVLLFVLSLIDFYTESGFAGFFSFKVNVLPYIIGLVIGTVMVLISSGIILPAAYKKQNKNSDTWSVVLIVVFLVLIIGSIAVSNKLDLKLMMPGAPLILISGGYVVLYLAARSVWRYKKYGTIFDEQKRMRKKAYSTRQLSGIAPFATQVEIELMKIWRKKCGKLVRRGRYTPETVIEKFKKDERMNDIFDKALFWFYVALYIAAVIGTRFDGESALSDTLVFAAVLGAAEFFIYRFFIRAFRSGAAVRKHIIAEAEKSGMNMPDYLDSVLEANEDK